MKTLLIISILTLIVNFIGVNEEKYNYQSKHNNLQQIITNDSLIFVDLLSHPIESNKDVEEIIFRLNKRKFEFY